MTVPFYAVLCSVQGFYLSDLLRQTMQRFGRMIIHPCLKDRRPHVSVNALLNQLQGEVASPTISAGATAITIALHLG